MYACSGDDGADKDTRGNGAYKDLSGPPWDQRDRELRKQLARIQTVMSSPFVVACSKEEVAMMSSVETIITI